MIGIYKIKNSITNDCYIGSSIKIKQRSGRHLRDLNNNIHHSIKLQRAVNKYGIENFIFEVIELCDRDCLIQREQFWMDSINPKYNIYHIAGSSLGVKHSKEVVIKMRKYALDNNIKPPDCTWKKRQKEVFMIDYIDNTVIKKFNSASEACRYLGKDCTYASTITTCCKNKRYSAFGFRWVFNVRDIPKLRVKKELKAWNKGLKIDNNKSKPIKQYDLEGNFLSEYKSVKYAENIFGKGISNCALGRSKTSGGFIWKY